MDEFVSIECQEASPRHERMDVSESGQELNESGRDANESGRDNNESGRDANESGESPSNLRPEAEAKLQQEIFFMCRYACEQGCRHAKSPRRQKRPEPFTV